MKRKLLPAVFLIIFMVTFAIMAICYMPTAISNTENPTLNNVIDGTWAPTFETSLNESFPIFESIRNFWGNFEYTFFDQGRKGVLVGKEGWLFTDEEFSCIPNGVQNMEQNLSYISDVYQIIKAKNIELAVIIIPSKARIYSNYLGKYKIPTCRVNLYNNTIKQLTKKNIITISLYDEFNLKKDENPLFLKTDTHWTPFAAKLASIKAAKEINTASFIKEEYKTSQKETIKHKGDLLRYLPGVNNDIIMQDSLHVYETLQVNNNDSTALDLFSDITVPVTLVGTSYSANSLWNFHGFLKDAMHVDILNMADEGLGPFEVMNSYLSSNTWKDTPPYLVIWEIPERYITTSFQKK